MSASPVLQTVLTALLSAGTAYVALQGPSNKHRIEPLLFMVFGVVSGSMAGLYVRTHDWLGQDLEQEATHWAARTGLSKPSIYQRMFEHEYATSAAPGAPATREGVLYSSPADVKMCDEVGGKHGDDLLRTVGALPDQQFADLAKYIKSPDMEYIIKRICHTQ